MAAVFTNPYREHVDAVERLAAVGVHPPQPWQELRARWADTDIVTESAVDRYADAIVTGAAEDLATLHTLALAEAAATPQSRAAITGAVQQRVLRKLRTIYAANADSNYRKVAALFDKAAATFGKCAAVVDPETDAADLVQADDRTRKAWVDALLAARELDALLPVLASAAALAGARTGSAEAKLALSVDTRGLHRRAVWTAFDSSGRCGRWSAIAAITQIRALPDLAELEPYRRAVPMQEKHLKVGRGMYRKVVVDPEDEPAEPAADRRGATVLG